MRDLYNFLSEGSPIHGYNRHFRVPVGRVLLKRVREWRVMGKKFKEQKAKRKNTSNGENWKGVMKYRTTGAKLGGKKFCLGNSRRQIDWKARLHLSIKLCVNQILDQINSSLSTLFSLWNTIIESYYTTKVQIDAKYSQHLPLITSAMAAGSKSRCSHVTFMARNHHYSRSKIFFPTFAPLILYFMTPFKFQRYPTSE